MADLEPPPIWKFQTHPTVCTCIPVLTYACDAKVFTANQINCFNVAMNDAICRVFGYN